MRNFTPERAESAESTGISLSPCSPWLCLALVLLASCKSTLSSIGCGEPDGGGSLLGSISLKPLSAASYPNLFRDLLGKSDSEISTKISDTFNQLFHGTSNESIYVEVGSDQAYIRDILHDEIRSEGIGLGMLFAVELDKRDEFDRLWRYAKVSQAKGGPEQGYFPSFCSNGDTDEPCFDPFGLQQITTALLLARGRWQDSPGSIDYGQEAGTLLNLIRNKESTLCGSAEGVTAPFDAASKLVFDMPVTASAGISRPSVVMPAYYDLWRQATGDDFWGQAAEAGREYLQASAHVSTGLMPAKAFFDGKPVSGFDTFQSECDRTFFNMALDRIWSDNRSYGDIGNHILQFFYDQDLSSYGQSFSLDGMEVLAPLHDNALVASNGVLAVVAGSGHRDEFVSAAWDMSSGFGSPRYYVGILKLWALLILGGHMRVY
jgi:oligosaccharide reducing-end xylanase